MRAGLHGKEEEVLDKLFRRSKKAKLVKDHPPPFGKPLCLRFPPALISDVYQIFTNSKPSSPISSSHPISPFLRTEKSLFEEVKD
ncbi:unnamed protein product [Prunus armeniaca]